MTNKQSQIIKSLKAFYKLHNRSPKSNEFPNTTICRYFKTWNNALVEAGLPLNTKPQKSLVVNCKQCSKTFSRAPSGIKVHTFCSNACSAIYNNRRRKRTKKEYICKLCHQPAKTRRKFCDSCFKNTDIPIHTLFDCNKSASKYARIRQRARKYYLSQRPHQCFICKYELHIDVCHIKPITSFSPDSLVSEVNAISNLAGLCKRCHWELDNGHLFL